VFASSSTTWIAAPCSPSTFPPVKSGRDNLVLNWSWRFLPSGPSICLGELFLFGMQSSQLIVAYQHKTAEMTKFQIPYLPWILAGPAGANLVKARSTSSLTYKANIKPLMIRKAVRWLYQKSSSGFNSRLCVESAPVMNKASVNCPPWGPLQWHCNHQENILKCGPCKTYPS